MLRKSTQEAASLALPRATRHSMSDIITRMRLSRLALMLNRRHARNSFLKGH